MLLKGSRNPQFKTKHISSLWNSRIPDYETLQKCIPRALLVGLDIEFSPQGVHEIGLALLQGNGEMPIFPEDRTLKTFYNENCVQTHSILIHEKLPTKKREKNGFGSEIIVSAEDVGPTVTEILAAAKSNSKGDIILAGFSLYQEFKWISEELSSLAEYFTAWVDVQDIAAELSGALRPPSLTRTMDGLGIVDRRLNPHRASNDATRCLAVLSGFISLDSSLSLPVKRLLLPYIPGPRSRHGKDTLAVIVTATNGNVLPYRSLRELSNLFAEYEIKAIALNKHALTKPAATGVKMWWLSFLTEQSLDIFVTQVHGSVVDDKELVVKRA